MVSRWWMPKSWIWSGARICRGMETSEVWLPAFCAGRVPPMDAAIARNLRDAVDLPPTVVNPWQGNGAP
jgi:hypothetical protein